MSRFEIIDEPLTGLFVLRRIRLGDERGYLSRLFCADDLRPFGWTRPVAQINETLTGEAGTLRGLHYQRPPFAEMKLITCLQGEVFDAVVDMRRDAVTFGRTFTVRLSQQNDLSLLVPQGFAHGFQTLTESVRMLYLHSAPYSAEHEAGIDALDTTLDINWPLPVKMRSARDEVLPAFSAISSGLET